MFGLRFRENKLIECQNSRKSSPYEREVSCCYSIHILFEKRRSPLLLSQGCAEGMVSPSLYTQIALTYFIFISIKRISTDILQCFFQILSRYPIRHSISGSEKFFSVSITQKYRSACPKSDFIKFFVIYHTFFQKFPDISGKKTLNLSRPDRPHLFYTNICSMSGFSTKRIPRF